MSRARLLNQALTIQTIGSTTLDEYNNQIPGGIGNAVPVKGFLEQRGTTEFINGRDTTVSQWWVMLPAGTVIGHLDYINFNSQKFQVDGEPHQVYNPRTRVVVQIECKLVVVNA
jgi:hypothetical protein